MRKKRFLLLAATLVLTLPAWTIRVNAKDPKPLAALTFDDGPSAANTAKILDVLEVNGAKATFFVIGRNAAENAELLQRAKALGCEIGNHTYDHAKLTELSAEKIRQQLQKTDDVVTDSLGEKPKLVRAPCGRCSCGVRSVIDRPLILWSVDPRDWEYGLDRAQNTAQNRETVIRAATENVQDGDIILLHDLYAFTAECCESIVPKLQSMGFELVTVSELMQRKGIELHAGQTVRCAR
ncbi:MAG: polysaccharide deacetylase family protein [Clostridia bacterium]|nr:polysaccharide deacetylase family protein [Clostridia bacterium]